ncbi:MAG: biopolymer transporter ExbD [Bacteroidales bacterium]|nr:biopolymer transporter ExbD [Bacteroidales bacterium]
MSLRSSNKISPSFSQSSMTDLIFLLLIFFMITSTLVSPYAVNLTLPQSNSKASAKPVMAVNIKDASGGLEISVGKVHVASYADMERELQQKLKDVTNPTFSLRMDKTIQVDEMVKVMNIAARNKYKVILATQAER